MTNVTVTISATSTLGTATHTIGHTNYEVVPIPLALGDQFLVSSKTVSTFVVTVNTVDFTNDRTFTCIIYDTTEDASTSTAYTTAYMVRMLAQVEYEQLEFNTNADLETFITNYLIPQADKRIDSYCNHAFGTLTVGTWTLDGNGKAVLFMPPERCPLLGVTAGSIDSVAFTAANMKVHDQYIEYDGGVFTSGKKNVLLSGSYGYTAVPKDIEHAAAIIGANMLNDMVRRKTLPDLFKKEDVSVMLSMTALTKETKELLDPYVLHSIDIG